MAGLLAFPEVDHISGVSPIRIAAVPGKPFCGSYLGGARGCQNERPVIQHSGKCNHRDLRPNPSVLRAARGDLMPGSWKWPSPVRPVRRTRFRAESSFPTIGPETKHIDVSFLRGPLVFEGSFCRKLVLKPLVSCSSGKDRPARVCTFLRECPLLGGLKGNH